MSQVLGFLLLAVVAAVVTVADVRAQRRKADETIFDGWSPSEGKRL